MPKHTRIFHKTFLSELYIEIPLKVLALHLTKTLIKSSANYNFLAYGSRSIRKQLFDARAAVLTRLLCGARDTPKHHFHFDSQCFSLIRR